MTFSRKWGKPADMWTSQETIQGATEKGFTLNTAGGNDDFLLEWARLALEKTRGTK
jgi:hypothetical protein